MTTNKTIDGVPIATIAAFARVADAYSEAEDDSYEPWQDAIMHAELRLTLGQFRELRALLDAKPAEEFNPEGWAIDHSAGRPILVHNNCSVIEAEQAYGLLELIKSAAQPQGEPVAWQYRVSAGPQTGWSLWHDGKGEEFKRSYQVETRPLYAEQPALVAVVLPERSYASDEDQQSMTDYEIGLGHGACEMWDKIKALNPSL